VSGHNDQIKEYAARVMDLVKEGRDEAFAAAAKTS
jgi:hypothetical protein